LSLIFKSEEGEEVRLGASVQPVLEKKGEEEGLVDLTDLFRFVGGRSTEKAAAKQIYTSCAVFAGDVQGEREKKKPVTRYVTLLLLGS